MSLGKHNKDGQITSSIVSFGKAYPLLLAIIIDIIKIIPYFDIVITLWLQIMLWNYVADNAYFQWLNIGFDFVDFPGMIHPFGDVLPLNTITMLIMMIYTRVPYNI